MAWVARGTDRPKKRPDPWGGRDFVVRIGHAGESAVFRASFLTIIHRRKNMAEKLMTILPLHRGWDGIRPSRARKQG